MNGSTSIVDVIVCRQQGQWINVSRGGTHATHIVKRWHMYCSIQLKRREWIGVVQTGIIVRSR